ncbi:carbamate kinase [Natranaerofaba carboxydovora]|uniref:carbamate kinase n=1 Tax=Natranaerofaba carboxydovora TaxID=2742683 RepID=UPI001F136C07|nr:carbamate kinase [Natranaerofaba carboxydovora]UMZ72588.1 Carbamate kinase 1 [Natranaerofaba carboxydovora]
MKLAIALGGNALIRDKEGNSYGKQLNNIWLAVTQLADLIDKGYDIILTHGNGPQVGDLVMQNEISKDRVPEMPLDVCVGMTQGQIGYMLQQQLINELNKRKIKRNVVSLVTQTVVDKDDPLFKKATKPIGPFFSKSEAYKFMREKGETLVEDSGKGWRKVVPSPEPIDIIEKETIKKLFEQLYIVIANGGGGIPVIKKNGEYKGVEAVIDKDLSGALIAEIIGADLFLVLTNVASVSINYGRSNERKLDDVDVEELKYFEQKGHFGQGSMAPKVNAAINYVENTGKKAIISSLDDVYSALQGKTGTHVRLRKKVPERIR